MPRLDTPLMVQARRQDTASLIEALAGPPPMADAAGEELMTRCRNAPRLLLQAMGTAAPPVRRRLVFLLGKVGGGGEREAVQAALLGALADGDARVRRNAAIGLGSAGDPAHGPALRAALEREVEPDVRASLMLAFGHVASTDDLSWVSSWKPATAREQRAADTVKARLVAQRAPLASLDMDTPIDRGAAPELWARRGLASLLAREAEELGLAARAIDRERVAVMGSPPLAALMQPRIALYPVLTCQLNVPPSGPAAAGRLFAESAVCREMRRLTAGDRITYRLTLSRSMKGLGRRREWIAAFAQAAAGLVNAATGYVWDVIVRPLPRGLLLAVRPAAVRDSRFAYRHRDLPASLHPTLAAAAARELPSHARDVVLDPCCGSGTLLSERALRGPYARLIGIDHLEKALDTARANLLGVANVTLRCEDLACAADLGSVQQIITNPPYGHRVGSADHARQLQRTLDHLAARILAPGGHLAVFRPLALPGPSQLRVVKRTRIDAGGIPVQLWIARKESGGG